MNKLILVATLLAGLLCGAFSAQARSVPLTQYNSLKHVDVSRDGSGLNLRFEFKNDIRQELEPRFYKRSIQLDFDLTYVDPPKKYYSVEDSSITQVYVSQFDSRLMRVRFILAEENGLERGDLKFNKNGKVLTVQVKNHNPGYDDSLDALLDRAVAVSREPVIEEANGESEVETTQAELSGIIKSSGEFPSAGKADNGRSASGSSSSVQALGELEEDNLPVQKEPVPLKLKDSQPDKALLVSSNENLESNSLWSSAVKMVSTLAFVVGLMFLVFHLFKKWVGKQGMFGGGEKAIRVISTGFLGPKKSIAMVEVAGRVLILGVANDQITLLSSLENEEEIERILSKKTDSAVSEGSRTIVIPPTREKDSKEKEENGKPDIYTSRKKRSVVKAKNTGKKFSGYVKEYASPVKKKARSLNDLKRMIRQRSGGGKVQVSA